MNKILEGIKVLDFGRYISCPYCGYILAKKGVFGVGDEIEIHGHKVKICERNWLD